MIGSGASVQGSSGNVLVGSGSGDKSTGSLVFSTGISNTGTAGSLSLLVGDSNSATGGNVPSDGLPIYGSSFTVASNSGGLERAGYTFAGWNTALDGSGTNFSAGGSAIWSLSSNTTLYAKWSANTLTVTYNTQGGSTISSGSTTTGGTIGSSPALPPTRGTDTFNGWFATASGGIAINFPYTHNATADFTVP